jgi:hypothetical protein
MPKISGICSGATPSAIIAPPLGGRDQLLDQGQRELLLRGQVLGEQHGELLRAVGERVALHGVGGAAPPAQPAEHLVEEPADAIVLRCC